MEKSRRGNDADASRHRRGSSIGCAATLSLDAFSRRALPQTWLAGRRTERLLRQGSSRDADRSQSAMAIFARWLTPFGARPSQLLHVVVEAGRGTAASALLLRRSSRAGRRARKPAVVRRAEQRLACRHFLPGA